VTTQWPSARTSPKRTTRTGCYAIHVCAPPCVHSTSRCVLPGSGPRSHADSDQKTSQTRRSDAVASRHREAPDAARDARRSTARKEPSGDDQKSARMLSWRLISSEFAWTHGGRTVGVGVYYPRVRPPYGRATWSQYGAVGPRFWGSEGRAHVEQPHFAQLEQVYLMASVHATSCVRVRRHIGVRTHVSAALLCNLHF
jgi:hypothetical protein